ncbi:MAG: hypothetical protein IIX44_00665 [Clostridia bacterium]|nr:hypothetical protein [Clostridia bacterium]
MNKLKDLITAIIESRGFSPIRVILTFLYAFSIGYGAVLFTESIGNYFLQAAAILMFGGGLYLGLKSLKKMFDRKMRERIARIRDRISQAISKYLDKIIKRVAKKLGIERKRVKGEDERDFIFKERSGGRRRKNRMKNPHPWNDADNATRVRFIFTEYMFGKIREGYFIQPKFTPAKMERDLAHEELEHTLFDTYTAARYSGGTEPISDTTVEELDELVEKKRKKKR